MSQSSQDSEIFEPEFENNEEEITLNYSEEPSVFYKSLVSKYGMNLNKLAMTEDLIEYCKIHNNEDVYILKKLLDINFSKDIECHYGMNIVTSQDYGCDLREIIYNRNGSLNNEKTQELLDLFKEKQYPSKINHILTDVDDTLFAHTSMGIAGSDSSWKEKVPYPGIISFYQQFYNKLDKMFQYSTILSATPGIMKSGRMSNTLVDSILQSYSFIQGNIETKRRLATQGIASAAQGLTQHFGRKMGVSIPDLGVHSSFGQVKFDRYKQYKTIFPEYRIIFIGDNGQGDVLAGKMMLDEPNTDTMVCIHKVVEGKIGRKESVEDKPGLYYFTDYYELATIFQTLGIFNADDVQQIGEETAQIVNAGPSQFTQYFTNVPGVNPRGGRKTRRKRKKGGKTKKSKKTNKNKSRKIK
jgi:hypothetical protein